MAADDEDDDIPAVARPDPTELDYDLDAALSALVCVRAETAPMPSPRSALGTERRGNGVVIGEDGLIVTIGYLHHGSRAGVAHHGPWCAAPAHVVAYDQVTGLGLVQALGRLGNGTLSLGSAAGLEPGQAVLVAGGRGGRDALNARLVAKRPFAGYWEYYLDDGAVHRPGPSAVGRRRLHRSGRQPGRDRFPVGAGGGREGQSLVGNMAVPIDLLPPILDDLLRLRPGRPAAPPLAGAVRYRRCRWCHGYRPSARRPGGGRGHPGG